MMRVGILGHGFIGWGGGLDFLRTVVSSLHATGVSIDFHALLPLEGPLLAVRRRLDPVRALLRREPNRAAAALGSEAINAAFASFGVTLTSHRIDIGSSAISKACRHLGLDVVMPSISPLSLSRDVPWVGYLYDFQHLHLPHFFSPQEIAYRNRAFGKILDTAPAIIVNSQAAASDAATFAPHAVPRLFALPFSAAPAPNWFDDSPPPLDRYGISGPYFIVCNQFWKHKDHLTAFKAFAAVAETHADAQLVCTGETADHRDPAYFAGLMQQASLLGISGRLHVLGLIPKRDQIALLRGAVALIQPTLFEGGPGGGSVYDAVSLGVPSLVSDIAVNLEISEPTVSFFRTGNANDLACQMKTALGEQSRSAIDHRTLLELGHARRKHCGEVLLQAIDRARR